MNNSHVSGMFVQCTRTASNFILGRCTQLKCRAGIYASCWSVGHCDRLFSSNILLDLSLSTTWAAQAKSSCVERWTRFVIFPKFSWSNLTVVSDVFPIIAPLDMSLKKNTAFIRKVRVSLNSVSLDSLLTDIRTVSLEKYLSEVVSAVTEGLIKCKTSADFFAGTEVSNCCF